MDIYRFFTKLGLLTKDKKIAYDDIMNIDKETDPEGKLYFAQFLMKLDFQQIEFAADPYSHHDMVAYKNGKKYYFELKYRPCLSTKYGDSIIDGAKFRHLSTIKDGVVYIVNLFEDYIYIHELNSYNEIQKHKCQRTNNWDKTRIEKELYSYKHTEGTKYEYI